MNAKKKALCTCKVVVLLLQKTSCFFAVFVAVAVVVKLRLVVILGWVVQSWVKITQR